MTASEIIGRFSARLAPLPVRTYNLGGSSCALLLSRLETPFIAVYPDEESALRLYKDIQFYSACFGEKAKVHLLPSADSPTGLGERAQVVKKIFLDGEGGSIVTHKDAASAPLWSPEELKERMIILKAGAEAGRQAVHEALEKGGYSPVTLVADKGQFSMRQWILDVFPATAQNPVRVEFFGDVVESIRTFETDGQRSTSEIAESVIMPASAPTAGGGAFTLLKDYVVICPESGDALEGARLISAYSLSGDGEDAGLLPIAGLGILPPERKDVSVLPDAVRGLDARVMFVSSSASQAERLGDILKGGGVIAPVISPAEAAVYEGRHSICVGHLSSGFFVPGLLVLTETEIFRKPQFRAMKESKVSGLIASLDDLSPGDYVVHKDYGIGRFAGLTRQHFEGAECDLMTVEYAGGDRLYLPLQGIARVTKYHSQEGALPAVDRLGGKSWLKTREKVRRRVKEMAGKLLNLYAEREVTTGLAFSEDTELHREFDSFFEYEETKDQLRAIEEIKKDMCSERPMDRLLCGDVGYGKTEVAMRAAFRAVFDGRQAAVIVPTTLLCEQHVRTFKSRFSAFPVRIDYISRFKPKKELSETLRAVAAGETDIVIGTHALFAKGVSFPNLGLLIVDEEHRFGVAQKERIKELKRGVDVLTLTATPIPRTLQMSLSGIRSMSVIETPPEERIAVKTTVAVFGEEVIREALGREAERGGQVFFVHNRIGDIEKIAGYVRKLMPHLRIAVAHGRMPERELEKVMLSFLNAQTDVLVSTAIIGSGLDIPSANTIIINMADRMGLADLYQLKGRVGRGSQRAYAYFLVPGGHAITDEAGKRLQAIQDMSYLGAGLRLAMRDLEIRGAGNMLGPEQSGYIEAVGFDMYIEMLETAVQELKGMKPEARKEARVDVALNAFIPEEYIPDMMLRLTIYRKIAASKDAVALKAVEGELRDRFGPLPEEVGNLLKVAGLKLLAEGHSVLSITQSSSGIRVVVSEGAGVAPELLLAEFPGRLRFHKDGFELKTSALADVERALKAIGPVSLSP